MSRKLSLFLQPLTRSQALNHGTVPSAEEDSGSLQRAGCWKRGSGSLQQMERAAAICTDEIPRVGEGKAQGRETKGRKLGRFCFSVHFSNRRGAEQLESGVCGRTWEGTRRDCQTCIPRGGMDPAYVPQEHFGPPQRTPSSNPLVQRSLVR